MSINAMPIAYSNIKKVEQSSSFINISIKMNERLKRKVSVFLHENKIGLDNYGLNTMACQCAYKVAGLDIEMHEQTMVYKTLDSYGRSVAKIKKSKFGEHLTWLFHQVNGLEQMWENHDKIQSNIFVNGVLALSELIMKLGADLTTASIVTITNTGSMRMLPLMPLAISFLQSQQSKVLTTGKDFKQIPRLTVIKISKTRGSYDRQIYDRSETYYMAGATNLQLIELYFQEAAMEIELEFRQYRLAINLSSLGLSAPLDNNFLYLFKWLIAEQIRQFEPGCIIFDDCHSIIENAIESKTLGLMIRLTVELSNCRILFVKNMSVYEQYHQTSEIIPPLIKIDQKDSELIHLDKYQKHVQLELAKNPKNDNPGLKNFQTKFKNNLKKQLLVILMAMQETIDVDGLQSSYFNKPISYPFALKYKEIVDQVNVSNASVGGRTKLNELLKSSSQIHQKIKKCPPQLRLSPSTNKFFNLKTNQLCELPISNFLDSDQYYVHYGATQTLVIIFRKAGYGVFRQNPSLKAWEQIKEVNMETEIMEDRQKGFNEYSVTGACLIASNNYLYRMFGKYNPLVSKTAGGQKLKLKDIYSNAIFRMRLEPGQEDSYILKRFYYKTNEQKNIIIQRRCNAAAVHVQVEKSSRVFVFGGHLQSDSEDSICRTIIIIENDTFLSVVQKFTLKLFQELLKAMCSFKSQLYCMPFSVQHTFTDIRILSTNAFNYQNLQRIPLYMSTYHVDPSLQKSTYISQQAFKQSQSLSIQVGNGILMDRKAFHYLLMHALLKSTETVNRYVLNGISKVAVYNSNQDAIVIFSTKPQDPKTMAVRVDSLKGDNQSFQVEVGFSEISKKNKGQN